MIQFPYKEKEPFKLDLIPMINVVFLLLIFLPSLLQLLKLNVIPSKLLKLFF